ncbi:hypothetical protein GE061_013067 [Apolygus lucorum]|uniref:Gustatory receptor n=1 Tax=Apolygus lucorum TaxID=248454 RepID=A0A6A4JXL2_APOLU|nr:hypothetical protein GE061_013067 [Apolygus lucorum]
MNIRRFFEIFFTICGFPIGEDHGRSWAAIIYRVVMISSVSVTYIWTRFLSKILAPTKTVVSVLDKLPLLSSITSYEINVIIAINIFHAFNLRKYSVRAVFRNGAVLDSLGAVDVLLSAASVGLCLPQIFRNLPLVEELRYIAYGIINTLNHVMLLQYCAILKYHTQDIRNQTKLLKTHKPTRNGDLSMICVHNYFNSTSALRVANELFSFRILVVFSGLVIDMAYLACYMIVRIISESISPWVKVLWTNMVVTRFLYILHLAGCCDSLKTSSEDFFVTIFALLRENELSVEDNRFRLLLVMNPKLQITACGFFTYGYPLVVSIIAAISTYLTVLVQFSHKY